ncbi:MAG TPA: leucine-rich repeat domain-containing protein, partial [Methanocorpusculum sp.]|nr:leucine-rich repeat domain-containing protein [Methanocorpusculum sp.]
AITSKAEIDRRISILLVERSRLVSANPCVSFRDEDVVDVNVAKVKWRDKNYYKSNVTLINRKFYCPLHKQPWISDSGSGHWCDNEQYAFTKWDRLRVKAIESEKIIEKIKEIDREVLKLKERKNELRKPDGKKNDGGLDITKKKEPRCQNEEGVIDVGVKLKYSIANGEAEIVFVPRSTAGAIEIPDKIKGCPVVSIGRAAFCTCKYITSVKIPVGVRSINNDAFSGCSGLRRVNLPDTITHIGDYAFWECSNLSSLKIPLKLKHIGNGTFAGCVSLSTVVIPSDVKSIGNQSFAGCLNLVSVKIPLGLESIGKDVFSGCEKLESIFIPRRLKSIGENVLWNCNALKTVYVEDGDGDRVSDMIELSGRDINGIVFTVVR